MSLMKTLAKVAIGVAVAKGAKAMMQKGASGNTGRAGQGGDLGGLLGGLVNSAGGGSRPHGGAHSPGGGIEDMLGGLLGGKGQSGGQSGAPTGGIGGLLEQLGGAKGGQTGGLGGLLGGLAGAAGGGGLGGLLAGTDETLQRRPERNDSSFGEVLNSQFDETPEPVIEPSRDQEAAAGLMLAAMIQAAKSDGTFDDAERDKLLGRLGDVDQAEAAFVQRQLQAPVDIDGLVNQTPRGMGPQVYAMSVLGIDLDSQDEAQYLHKLAQGLGLKPAEVNDIHAQMGIASLYT